ncbi:MAG: hypothetical protein F6J90_16940 [Moorea sp. SIOASIH]|nr:hypothetical protein [Moorena sp. SIOASIH]NEO91811.1 hypothetical protein [Moorena sp. SIO3G5]
MTQVQPLVGSHLNTLKDLFRINSPTPQTDQFLIRDENLNTLIKVMCSYAEIQ